MARPKKTGLDYFSHDVNASSDPKLEPAILRFGSDAYAFYFVHLEYCYKSDNLSIDISPDSESGVEMREVIQKKLQITSDRYDLILNSFLRSGAFDASVFHKKGHLTSNGIKKRANVVVEKRLRNQAFYDKNKTIISAAETTQKQEIKNTETHVETAQIKVKKSKVKKSKEKSITCNQEQPVIDLFNSICVSLPKVRLLTDTRRKQIKSAEKAVQAAGGFEALFRKVESSGFLTGRTSTWQCCFDWILKPANLTKIIEGNYDDRKVGNKSANDTGHPKKELGIVL